jgi:hypothetical protein
VDEIMEDMQYGPNGGLVFCMEYLIQNLDWLRDEVGDFEEDYLIIDCPGTSFSSTSSSLFHFGKACIPNAHNTTHDTRHTNMQRHHRPD